MSKKGGSFDGGPVGYKKPPAAHQFKKGHKRSGGRRKGKKNYDTLVEELLNSSVRVLDNGVPRKLTVREALLKRAVRLGLTGNLADIDRVHGLLARLAPAELGPGPRVVHFYPVDGDEEWFERVHNVDSGEGG